MRKKNPELIRKYTREETSKQKINRYKGVIRRQEKEIRILNSEIKTLERALRESLERIAELTQDRNLEELIGKAKEKEEAEDIPDAET